MEDCLFCRIIKGEIPCFKIYEDKNVLAFLDIAPVAPGHTLVIPKKHYKNIEEISSVDFSLLMNVVKKVGQAMKEKFKVEGYNVNCNNDPVAGQIIPHLHFHLIPRSKGDSLELWPQGEYSSGEAEEIRDKLKIN